MEKQNYTLKFPEDLNEKLNKMSEETGFSKAQLVLMAAHSLIANYEDRGRAIFLDILIPGNKSKK